jgi:3,4-dihydroxy 2-butanone 4-phosphate synthase/GTP cyclohydrolase II
MTAAGLRPVAAISEIVADDGEMMRLPGLIELGRREGVPVVTIAQIIAYRLAVAETPTTTDDRSVGRPAPTERTTA